MKFREYDRLFVKILKDTNPTCLENKIENISEQYNLIDMQYSSTTMLNDDVEYSVLLLLQEKNL